MRKVLLFFFMIAGAGSGNVVNHTLRITPEKPKIDSYRGFDRITLDGTFFIPEPGRPLLPIISITLVIPADARLHRIDASPATTNQIEGKFIILPGQFPVTISASQLPEFCPPDTVIYRSDEPWPAQPLVNYSVHHAGGFQLVNLLICPFTYFPLSGRLLLHTEISLTVTFGPGLTPVTPITIFQRNQQLQNLRPLVVNPEDLTTFAPPIFEKDQLSIDYLIITSRELSESFQPYLEYRRQRGMRTEIRTTDWIEANYPGRDLQEKIRNHIIDYYHNRGVVYVLLAGDNRQIPSRQICVNVGNEQGMIPTDLYYGDLDYSWDSNHNNLFGEMDDSVDLYADVFVGRASVETREQVRNFISKVLAFENTPAADYIQRSLLPSGWLWRSLNYHGKFVNDSIAELTPSGWTDRKMENPPGAGVVADSFNNGFLIFDPAGHGNESGVYDENGTPIYTTSYAGYQTNHNRYSIITSLACNPGNFEAEDCLAEVALNCPDGGAIGVMMNSRYGWGTPPVMGPSEKLCVRFYDYLLARSEYLLGPAHNRSREEYAGSAIYSSLWRWCLTEFNLLGDPTLDIWTAPPRNMTITAPDTITTGSQTLSVNVYENTNPASGVTVTACKDNEVLVTGITGSNGQVNINIHPFTPGELQLTAIRHNNLPATKIVTVLQGAAEPYLVYCRYEIDDTLQSNPNHILEPGETARLKVTIKNTGTGPATSVRLTLTETSPYIEIIDTTAILGTILPGESATAENITITAVCSALPGSGPEFTLYIHSDQNSWQTMFSINLGYSGRTWADISADNCALTVTARGGIGYDTDDGRQGRGFRYPINDTSSLYLASFTLGNSPDYLVDRFYRQHGIDRDWQLNDSIRTRLPVWNSAQLLQASFTDLNHPRAKSVIVDQRALVPAPPGPQNTVILVYDLWNAGAVELNNLYAGILADFDVIATDRLHDLAWTFPEQRTAVMRNVNNPSRFLGIKQLYPATPVRLTCIDHAVYVYPDSAMTEDMKYRAITGNLGVRQSDHPFNWSISVSTGPFDLMPGAGKRRMAFAFIGAPDSISFLNTCQTVQEWYDQNVGMQESQNLSRSDLINFSIEPSIFNRTTTVHLHLPLHSRLRLTVHDIAGRTVTQLFNGSLGAGNYQFVVNSEKLATGVYFVRLESQAEQQTLRILRLK
ncbi:MAG: C25 family cysteine peptidase [candidate division WOR-3 bacterium]